ncbi:class I SAM-dependent methyltransferase [Luteipulveratus flavus]|uniref:Class I SAM-dependent methyltransferase n=1 Tax=Luteipulveratus flavus TaxID=3031728 RepID=A0ABT6C5A0_9MICO|nr:class I SAM-dependent methyltransferase [Luteipulveratus sp. YIM 133296]MDF8264121.1 class I SAM-dependent methyltransferase [Luteipulveratus sp. YIM 133296]
MPTTDRAALESALTDYYDREAGHRHDSRLPADREEVRAEFVELLTSEGRTSVLEVGCGPGRDGVALSAAGLAYAGVDLAPESVRRCVQHGLDARVASVHALPYDDDAFDAGWTMSTLLHVPAVDLTAALTEITRVLRPGAPLAIGVWGAPVSREEHWEEDARFGSRFFSLRSDGDLRAAVDAFGVVERWRTWPGSADLHYQWLVLRCR